MDSVIISANIIHAEPQRTTMYTCCRDGQQKENTAPRKTSQKRKCSASRKLPDTFCLARMTATEYLESGKVVVDYIATHTGHDLNVKECKYLPLPTSVRKQVMDMLASGVQLEKVLEGEFIIVANIINTCILYYHHILQSDSW